MIYSKLLLYLLYVLLVLNLVWISKMTEKNLLTKVKPFLNFFYKISLYNLRTLNRPLILTAYYYFIA